MLTSIQTKKPQKNKFDLSREAKLTCNMGELVPCFIQDVIPGDSFKVNTQQLLRFSPLLAPSMHRIDLKIDYFYVPYRLVWDEWKDFITGGEDGNDLPSYPRINVNGDNLQFFKKGSLQDYLGIPTIESGALDSTNVDFDLSVLPQRAYQLIYHEYFRDQNVGTEFEQYTYSGYQQQSHFPDVMKLRKTNWEKDYFTSALPFLQRGPEVTLPLGQFADLEFIGFDPNGTSNIPPGYFQGTTSVHEIGSPPYNAQTGASNIETDSSGRMVNGTGNIMNPNITLTHQVNLQNATASTINELRKASALQQWLELMARAGSRYREQIFAMFGERIPDYTVQVPQYLGGGKTPIMISEVLSNYQDSQNPDDRPIGDMSGHGVALGDNLGFTQSFDEHGIVLGLLRVVPKTSYCQGLSKFWTKFDKFDHYFPQFANLGEQEVKNSELYLTGNEQTDEQVFGYQQRYSEYKYCNSTISGDFIDNLSYWELSRRFSQTPVLNQSFIECNPDSRIFAITDEEEHKLWIQLYHDVNALRPMPYHANPMLT